jgi:hypothetical protein
MGEGTKYATTSGDVRMKFIEQINYQEIDEGEVSFFHGAPKSCLLLRNGN